MNKIIVIIIIIILVGVGGYFIFGQGNKNTNSGINPIPGKKTENNITIKNFSFSPSTLNINAGTTVSWTNEDSALHRIKSDTFNSGDLNENGSFQFTFSQKGTYDYICGIHPSMKGQIIVK